jgi:hypothetical protein
MESKAKREGEAAAGGVDATIAAAPIAATFAPATAAAAVDGLAKPPQIHFQRPVTADAQQHAPILPQSAAARQDVAAAAPLHSNQSQCKSCTDASARLEALQVRAGRFCPRCGGAALEPHARRQARDIAVTQREAAVAAKEALLISEARLQRETQQSMAQQQQQAAAEQARLQQLDKEVTARSKAAAEREKVRGLGFRV